jgi:hypothetical protein
MNENAQADCAEHNRQSAKAILAELLERNDDRRRIDFIHWPGMRDNPNLYKLLMAIYTLSDDLLAWAKEER